METTKMMFLRKKLLNSIGFEKANSKSLKILIEKILQVTGHELSYNTMRRFFGLLKSTDPSTKTWKILQNYVEKISGTKYNGHVEHINFWRPINDLYIHLSKKDRTDVLNFLSQSIDSELFPILIATITNQLIASKDFEFLEELYKTHDLFGITPPQTDSAAQIICEMLKNMPIEELKSFEKIFKLSSFKEKIFYFYIDYGGLNGYYGYFLERFAAENNQERVFLSCILGYRNYLNGGILNPAVKVSNKELETFYPVLVGRYVGYLILSQPGHAAQIIKRNILPFNKKLEPHYFFLEIFPALMLTKDFISIQFLIDSYYEPLYEMDHWYSYSPYNIYQIAESLLYLYEGELSRAKVVFNSIQIEFTPSSYYCYVSLFYLILCYHISESEYEKSQVFEKYRATREQTGFARFDDAFLVNYFN